MKKLILAALAVALVAGVVRYLIVRSRPGDFTGTGLSDGARTATGGGAAAPAHPTDGEASGDDRTEG